MKKVSLILVFLISSLTVVGQELDKTFCVPGLLTDYMGRIYPKNNPLQWNYIMTLHQSKSGEIKRIEGVTGLKFDRQGKKKNCLNCQQFYLLKTFVWVKKNGLYN